MRQIIFLLTKKIWVTRNYRYKTAETKFVVHHHPHITRKANYNLCRYKHTHSFIGYEITNISML